MELPSFISHMSSHSRVADPTKEEGSTSSAPSKFDPLSLEVTTHIDAIFEDCFSDTVADTSEDRLPSDEYDEKKVELYRRTATPDVDEKKAIGKFATSKRRDEEEEKGLALTTATVTGADSGSESDGTSSISGDGYSSLSGTEDDEDEIDPFDFLTTDVLDKYKKDPTRWSIAFCDCYLEPYLNGTITSNNELSGRRSFLFNFEQFFRLTFPSFTLNQEIIFPIISHYLQKIIRFTIDRELSILGNTPGNENIILDHFISVFDPEYLPFPPFLIDAKLSKRMREYHKEMLENLQEDFPITEYLKGERSVTAFFLQEILKQLNKLRYPSPEHRFHFIHSAEMEQVKGKPWWIWSKAFCETYLNAIFFGKIPFHRDERAERFHDVFGAEFTKRFKDTTLTPKIYGQILDCCINEGIRLLLQLEFSQTAIRKKRAPPIPSELHNHYNYLRVLDLLLITLNPLAPPSPFPQDFPPEQFVRINISSNHLFLRLVDDFTAQGDEADEALTGFIKERMLECIKTYRAIAVTRHQRNFEQTLEEARKAFLISVHEARYYLADAKKIMKEHINALKAIFLKSTGDTYESVMKSAAPGRYSKRVTDLFSIEVLAAEYEKALKIRPKKINKKVSSLAAIRPVTTTRTSSEIAAAPPTTTMTATTTSSTAAT